MSFRTADYDYPLPEQLIAMYPAQRREQSRLMLIERNTERISHCLFADIASLILPDELVVLNNTKVIPARIRFENRNAELLLLQPLDPVTWRCLVRPGRPEVAKLEVHSSPAGLLPVAARREQWGDQEWARVPMKAVPPPAQQPRM